MIEINFCRALLLPAFFRLILSACLSLVGLLVLPGCSQPDGSAEPGETPAIVTSGNPVSADIESQTKDAVGQVSNTLFGTKWLVQEIEGRAATFDEGQKVAFITFIEDDGRIHGFNGCNVFNGAFTSDGDRFAFGPMMTTLQACGDDDWIESAFMRALEGSERFVVEGANLIGYRQDSRVLVFSST